MCERGLGRHRCVQCLYTHIYCTLEPFFSETAVFRCSLWLQMVSLSRLTFRNQGGSERGSHCEPLIVDPRITGVLLCCDFFHTMPPSAWQTRSNILERKQKCMITWSLFFDDILFMASEFWQLSVGVTCFSLPNLAVTTQLLWTRLSLKVSKPK